MKPIFGLLYTVLLFSYIATALFIVFHVIRYSLTTRTRFFGAVLFLSVLGVLLFTNALLFFSLPFDILVPNNYSL
ncbi:MAG: hypothetical protein AAB519_03780 [Patescibacteria group bacterium]